MMPRPALNRHLKRRFPADLTDRDLPTSTARAEETVIEDRWVEEPPKGCSSQRPGAGPTGAGQVNGSQALLPMLELIERIGVGFKELAHGVAVGRAEQRLGAAGPGRGGGPWGGGGGGGVKGADGGEWGGGGWRRCLTGHRAGARPAHDALPGWRHGTALNGSGLYLEARELLRTIQGAKGVKGGWILEAALGRHRQEVTVDEAQGRPHSALSHVATIGLSGDIAR